MNIPDSVNIITVLIICIFTLPILIGIIRTFSGERMYRSLSSLLGTILLLVAVILAVYLTRLLYSDGDNFIFSAFYKIIPAFKVAVTSQDIFLYALFVLIIMLIVFGLLNLLMLPVYRFVLAPISDRASKAVNSMNGFSRRFIGGLWKLPKAILLVLIFSLLLNFYTIIQSDSVVTEYAESSVPYQVINTNVIKPLLDTGVIKNIQVILNDSFKAAGDEISSLSDKGQLTRYINGMTLDDAVKSNTDIDRKAIEIVGSETNTKRKAYLIYEWICRNIKYDDSKAAMVVKDPSSVSSGAIVAYQTKKGICFDYSCLYVAMCREAGLKVRFLTGLGYTGREWGDHAWNEVFCTEENRWISVDTTFGSTGIDFFDSPDFDQYHTNAVVQEEW